MLGYIRVSDHSEENIQSANRQREMLKNYAKLQGAEITIYEDIGVSGYKDNRPGWQHLRASLIRDSETTLVVCDLSRLTRKTRTLLEFFEDVIKPRNIKFVSLKESIDTATPVGTMMLMMMGIFNQWYRDEISHRSKIAKKHKREKNEYCGGKIPWGKKISQGKLVDDEQQQRDIATLRSMKDLGPEKIRRKLNELGVKTPIGGSRWSHSSVRYALARL